MIVMWLNVEDANMLRGQGYWDAALCMSTFYNALMRPYLVFDGIENTSYVGIL